MQDVNWRIGGEAGDGILSAGLILAKTFMRKGYHTIASAEYPNLIRGGHNNLDVRISHKPITSHSVNANILVALNKQTIDIHSDTLSGGVIYDPNEVFLAETDHATLIRYPIPLLELAGGFKNRMMRNTVALGATMYILGGDLQTFFSVLRDSFGKKKGEEIANENIRVAQLGYDFAKSNFKQIANHPPRQMSKQILVSGNDAFCLGAIKSGCKFLSSYPMTPASSVLTTMAALENSFSHVVVQTEDEISAINMAIGASFAGVRSMVATSGGGFSLMVEGLGLAAITETPIVIVEAMRPGPATGMATRTGQSDLRFVLHAGTDEFPRIVLAPSSQEECFVLGAEAFNLAEERQLPVFFLTDKYLAEGYKSIELPNAPLIRRGKLLESVLDNYKRYEITDDGISPRAIPGIANGQFVASSYEHDEYGNENEDSKNRIDMVKKRAKKLNGIEKNKLLEPEILGEGKIAIVTWGSSFGSVLEAQKILDSQGIKIKIIRPRMLNPMHDLTKEFKHSKLIIGVEANSSGQLCGVIREQTGFLIEHKLLKYDGRPFDPIELAKKIKHIGSEQMLW